MTGRRSHGRLSALNGVVHQGNGEPAAVETRAEPISLCRKRSFATLSSDITVQSTSRPSRPRAGCRRRRQHGTEAA